MPLAELAVFGCGDRDAAEPPTVERQRGDCEPAPRADLVGALDRGALLVSDDERLVPGEEAFRRLVVEVHPGEALTVELRVTVGRADAELSTGAFPGATPTRAASRASRADRSTMRPTTSSMPSAVESWRLNSSSAVARSASRRAAS